MPTFLVIRLCVTFLKKLETTAFPRGCSGLLMKERSAWHFVDHSSVSGPTLCSQLATPKWDKDSKAVVLMEQWKKKNPVSKQRMGATCLKRHENPAGRGFDPFNTRAVSPVLTSTCSKCSLSKSSRFGRWENCCISPQSSSLSWYVGIVLIV